ncbi:RICIN domain-containing protein [Streptomyces sp. NPDC096351]|uniref:RICIN domain-containing protein n=1 Tax=Streptomyces sp. NPDC096351 TaxID=3366087 RepID=UPI0037FA0512
MSKRVFHTGLTVTLGVIAMSLAGMPGSASATEAGIQMEGYQYKNVQTGLCLDSDAKGNAYTKDCGVNNPYQRWSLVWKYDGYVLRNEKTLRCLQVDGGDAVSTGQCSNYPATSQQWDWDSLDGQRMILKSTSNGRALDSNHDGQLYTSPRSTSNPYMQWWQW